MNAIHATAVAIGGEALLIRGPSRAGKSRLAAALIARSTRQMPIVLIGDDRILLSESGDALIARPHPRIAGFIERRGLGIVAMAWRAEAPVGGIVVLHDGRDLPSPLAGEDARRADEGAGQIEPLPEAPPHPPASPAPSPAKGEGGQRRIPEVSLTSMDADPACVLAWWAARGAAFAPHLPRKASPPNRPRAKD